MVQEFYVLRCCSCGMYQVQIVEKIPKWECKVCGERQSLIKVILRSANGKECRSYVQELNAKNIQIAETASTTNRREIERPYLSTHEAYKHCDRKLFTLENNQEERFNIQNDIQSSSWHSRISDRSHSNSKWFKYLNEDQIGQSFDRSTNYLKGSQEELDFSIDHSEISHKRRKLRRKKLPEDQYERNKEGRSMYYEKACSESHIDLEAIEYNSDYDTQYDGNLRSKVPDVATNCKYLESNMQVLNDGCNSENPCNKMSKNPPIALRSYLPNASSKWSKYLSSSANTHSDFSNNVDTNNKLQNHNFQSQHKRLTNVYDVQSINNPQDTCDIDTVTRLPLEREEFSNLDKMCPELESNDNKWKYSKDSSGNYSQNQEVYNGNTNKMFDQEVLDFSI